MLEHWFSISTAKVKWNNVLSESVPLAAGVRQGGVLSPLLFSAFIDIVLSELENFRHGCFINRECFNSLLYADDLLLLSTSVTDLQLLIDKCLSVFDLLDLQINSAKSVCLRIGNRFRASCGPILAKGNTINWVNEFKYLGVMIKCGVRFSCSWRDTRCNFYKSLNSFLSGLGSNPNINVALSLFRSLCIPILCYGTASIPLSVSELRSFSFAYDNIFCKLFKSRNFAIVCQCQYFCVFFTLSPSV